MDYLAGDFLLVVYAPLHSCTAVVLIPFAARLAVSELLHEFAFQHNEVVSVGQTRNKFKIKSNLVVEKL